MTPQGHIPDYMRLLDAEALAKIHRLELAARGTVEGFVSGRHRSPYKGFSVEFAEHRQYVPGDDTRSLDWRVWGRSDRYYIKQFIEESNLRATILLDASGSMAPGGAPAKFHYALRTAAALAYVAMGSLDRVILLPFAEDLGEPLRTGRSRMGIFPVLDFLAALGAAGALLGWLGLAVVGAIVLNWDAYAWSSGPGRIGPGGSIAAVGNPTATPRRCSGWRACRASKVGWGKCHPVAAAAHNLVGGGLHFLLGVSASGGRLVWDGGVALWTGYFGLLFLAGHFHHVARQAEADRAAGVTTVATQWGVRRALVVGAVAAWFVLRRDGGKGPEEP